MALAERRERLIAEQFLVPTLCDCDIVDNLPAHKVSGASAAIEAADATNQFLPRYSPDYDPIEQAFAKNKAIPRKAAARTADAVDLAIAGTLNTFESGECVVADFFNDFRTFLPFWKYSFTTTDVSQADSGFARLGSPDNLCRRFDTRFARITDYDPI